MGENSDVNFEMLSLLLLSWGDKRGSRVSEHIFVSTVDTDGLVPMSIYRHFHGYKEPLKNWPSANLDLML